MGKPNFSLMRAAVAGRLGPWWGRVSSALAPRPGPMQLDFSRAQTRARGPALVAMGIGAIVLSLALWQSDMHAERIAGLEAELLSLGYDRAAERRRAEKPQKNGEETEERVKKANAVIRRLATPWDDVFTTIEKQNGRDVAVLSLEPDPTSAQVRVGAEARNPGAMLDYLERLRNSSILSPAILQSHQVMTEDPNKPIRFSFTASWTSAKRATN